MPRLNFGAFLAPHHPIGEHPMLQFRRDLDLVEQNARVALKYAHRGYVLETGNIKLEGNAKELAQNEEVKKAYLGE